MAEDTGAKLTLPAEMRDNLTKMSTDFEKAEKAITSLESLGMDCTELKEKLAWSKKTRDVLLKDFGE